jgi:hypothetical protein
MCRASAGTVARRDAWSSCKEYPRHVGSGLRQATDAHVGHADDVNWSTPTVFGEAWEEIVKVLGHYDTELQMFTESSRAPGPAHLGFLRWLAGQGRLEHNAMGAPVGRYVTDGDDLDAPSHAA